MIDSFNAHLIKKVEIQESVERYQGGYFRSRSQGKTFWGQVELNRMLNEFIMLKRSGEKES